MQQLLLHLYFPWFIYPIIPHSVAISPNSYCCDTPKKNSLAISHEIPIESPLNPIHENHHRINSNFCKSRNLGNHGNRGNHPGKSPYSRKSPRPFHRQSHKKSKRKKPVALALHLGRRELLIHQGGVHDLRTWHSQKRRPLRKPVGVITY